MINTWYHLNLASENIIPKEDLKKKEERRVKKVKKTAGLQETRNDLFKRVDKLA